MKNESPEHKPNEQGNQKVEEIKDHNTSQSISGQNSNSFSLENFLKNKDLEEKEANSITKVKNMILSYANVNNGESSTTGNNFPLLNNEGFSTSSTNRNQTKASSSSIDEFEYKEFQIFSNYSKQEEKKTKEKLTIKVTGPADIKNDIEKETSHTKRSVIEDKSSKKKVVSSQKSKKETKSVQKTRDSAVKNKEMETTTPKTPRGKSSAKSTRESAIFLHIPDRRVSQYSEFTEITETTGRKSRGKSLASDFKSSNKKKNSRISSVDLQLSTSTLLAPPRPSTSKKVVTKKQSQPKSLGKSKFSKYTRLIIFR